MHLVRTLIITTLFFFLAIHSSVAQTMKADSLLLRIEKAHGETKLKFMLELLNVNQTSQELINSIEMLEIEAKCQKNMRYLACSYTVKARYFIDVNDLDSAVYWAEQANVLYDKYDINNPNQSYYYLSHVYLSKGYYDLAIYNLKIYLEKNNNEPVAYQKLGQLYFVSGRFNLAKENYQKVIEIYNRIGYISLEWKIYIHREFAVALVYNEDYEIALETCKTMNDILSQDLNEFSKSTKNLLQYLTYQTYTGIYIAMKDAKMAKLYLEKLEQIPQNDISKGLECSTISNLSDYFFLLEDYNQSLSYLNEALICFEKEITNNQVRFELTQKKIDILEKLGRYHDAFFIQKKFMNNKDSIHNENIPLQISQLSKSYELDKVRLEQQKNKAQLARSEAVNIGLIVGISLLCIILYLLRRNSKEIKAKNEMLFKQYAEVDKYINLSRERFVTEEKDKAIIDREFLLFDKIEEYMTDQEAYRDPNLDREQIAGVFNTNSRYVIDAIKKETGKTFFDYVNKYRLNYARIQLLKDDSILVGNIILDSGFSSNPTFYRLFKQKFGMSPRELREIKAKLEHDVIENPNDETSYM